MGAYAAVVGTASDGTTTEAGPVIVEVRNRHTAQTQRITMGEFTGGHLPHLAVAGARVEDIAEIPSPFASGPSSGSPRPRSARRGRSGRPWSRTGWPTTST